MEFIRLGYRPILDALKSFATDHPPQCNVKDVEVCLSANVGKGQAFSITIIHIIDQPY